MINSKNNIRYKVLFIHHAIGIGGAPISMIETIKSLDKTIFEVEVLLLKDSIVKEMLIKEGVKVSVAPGFFYQKIYQFFPHIEPHYFKWWEIEKITKYAFFWILSRFFFSKKLLKKYSFDILHLNSSVLSDFLKSGKDKGKVVMHIREPVARGYLGIRLAVMRHEISKYADHVIAISEDNAGRLACQHKTTVVYNFTAIGSRPTDETYVLGKIALYLGGESLIKGFLTMVDSLDYLDEEIKVWFCGYYREIESSKGTCFYKIKRKIKLMLPINNRIERAVQKIRVHPKALILGLRSDIPNLLANSCVLVSPFSIEHFSRPVIEAFANGRCAIGTDVEGMDELINHGVNGLIVKKNSPLELAKAINMLCTNKKLNLSMANAGYEMACKRFSRKNIEKIQDIYFLLLKEE